jgi:hypothetical protein
MEGEGERLVEQSFKCCEKIDTEGGTSVVSEKDRVST